MLRAASRAVKPLSQGATYASTRALAAKAGKVTQVIGAVVDVQFEDGQ